jgi:hypothetical protein
MQTVNGTVLNLNSICTVKTQPSTSTVQIIEISETITIPLTNLNEEINSSDKVREEICKTYFEPSQLSKCLQAASNVDVSTMDSP